MVTNMKNYYKISMLFILVALVSGCVKKGELEFYKKQIEDVREELNAVKNNTATAVGQEDIDNLDARFTAITEALTEQMSEVQAKVGELETRFQTVGSQLAESMNQIAEKNVQIDTLDQQVKTLEGEKANVEQLMLQQVRASEIRASRLEQVADSYFDSLVIRQYREQKPNATATNQQLIVQIGDFYKQNEKFNQLLVVDPEFGQKYQKAKSLASLGQ